MSDAVNGAFRKTVTVLKALSDETRLRIYRLLLEEPLCVCELIYILGYKQSRVSHSLRALKQAGLVASRRQGKLVSYSVNRRLLSSKILQGLKAELKIPAKDRRRYERCKGDKVKERYAMTRAVGYPAAGPGWQSLPTPPGGVTVGSAATRNRSGGHDASNRV